MKVDISGIESIQKAVENKINAIENQVPIALQQVGSEMMGNLQNHLDQDFYKRYTPHYYPRRKDSPQFGISIYEKSNMNISVDGKSMVFIYAPNGAHSGKLKDTLGWDAELAGKVGRNPDDKIISSPRNGTALIDWAQKEHKLKDGVITIPARPFYSKFIAEQRNEKIIENFALGMKPFNVEIKDKKV